MLNGSSVYVPRKTFEIVSGYEGLSGFDPITHRYYPYHVTADSAGLMTIGRGHLISVQDLRSGRFVKGLTSEEVEDLFVSDLNPRAQQLSKLITMALTTEDQFAACLAEFYNLEIAFLPGHTLGDLHRARKYKDAAAAFFLYIYSGSPKVAQLGLWRRQGTQSLCYATGKVIIAKDDKSERVLFQALHDAQVAVPPKPTRFYHH